MFKIERDLIKFLPFGNIIGIVSTFISTLILIIAFSIYYVKKYTNSENSQRATTITAVLSLVFSLSTCSLLPIDIFIVSTMKYSNGTFKEWAADNISREHIESQVSYSYYTLYSIVFIFIFFVIPFMYFHYEEEDSDLFDSNRYCNALKYTIIFVLMATFSLLFGAFVPLREESSFNKNETWIDILKENRGEDALSMALSLLSAIGMMNVVVYTAFGMFSWPISLIKGTKSAATQMENLEERHFNNTFNINSLREKLKVYGLTDKEICRLKRLEEQERLAAIEEKYLSSYRSSFFYRLRFLFRPIQMMFGSIILLISILIWISLLITNTDKAFHSLGMKMGYALPNFTYPNPINFILIHLQTVYPLDHILMLVISLTLVLYTVSGYKHIGIRFLCFKVYKIVPSKTQPQAILVLFALVMLTTMGINVLFYSTAPEYVTYGNQFYFPSGNNSILTRCTLYSSDDHCTMTRLSALLIRFFFKAWFFGVYYYWATWAFLLISIFSLIYVTLKPKESITEGLLDENFEEEE